MSDPMSRGAAERKSTRKRQLPVRYSEDNEYETKATAKTNEKREENRLQKEIDQLKSENDDIVGKNETMIALQKEMETERDEFKRKGEEMRLNTQIIMEELRASKTRIPDLQKEFQEKCNLHKAESAKLKKMTNELLQLKNNVDPEHEDKNEREKIENLKKCPYCRGYFTNESVAPLVLKCGHLLCKRCCIVDYEQNGSIFCIGCQNAEPIANVEEIDAFPICHSILSIM
uniref:RING-type domain-containing protein n=1 Tax=Caenorhabditis tropicalis TaxID=1561998 RepID=A0A1I7TLK7_9PELO